MEGSQQQQQRKFFGIAAVATFVLPTPLFDGLPVETKAAAAVAAAGAAPHQEGSCGYGAACSGLEARGAPGVGSASLFAPMIIASKSFEGKAFRNGATGGGAESAPTVASSSRSSLTTTTATSTSVVPATEDAGKTGNTSGAQSCSSVAVASSCNGQSVSRSGSKSSVSASSLGGGEGGLDGGAKAAFSATPAWLVQYGLALVEENDASLFRLLMNPEDFRGEKNYRWTQTTDLLREVNELIGKAYRERRQKESAARAVTGQSSSGNRQQAPATPLLYIRRRRQRHCIDIDALEAEHQQRLSPAEHSVRDLLKSLSTESTTCGENDRHIIEVMSRACVALRTPEWAEKLGRLALQPLVDAAPTPPQDH